MNSTSNEGPARAGALLCLLTGATWALWGQTWSLRHPPNATFDALLTGAAAWTCLAGLGWALLICAAAVIEALTSGRLGATAWVCPVRVREVLLPVLGIVLATGVTAPARAAAAPSARTDPAGAAARSLPVPVRPTDTERPTAVVRAGDTLWGLTSERIDATSDAEIARVVRHTHHLNRSVIGPDPDLIRPGQRLTLPHPQEER